MPPDLALFLTLISSNYLSRTYFHGSEGVRATEVLLYLEIQPFKVFSEMFFISEALAVHTVKPSQPRHGRTNKVRHAKTQQD